MNVFLIHQELKVHRAQTTLTVVDDVLSPNFAFDVDENTSYKKTKSR